MQKLLKIIWKYSDCKKIVAYQYKITNENNIIMEKFDKEI